MGGVCVHVGWCLWECALVQIEAETWVCGYGWVGKCGGVSVSFSLRVGGGWRACELGRGACWVRVWISVVEVA